MAGPKTHPDTIKALRMIESGASVFDAAKKYGVHPSTLNKARQKAKRIKGLQNNQSLG